MAELPSGVGFDADRGGPTTLYRSDFSYFSLAVNWEELTYLVTLLDHLHKKLRDDLQLPNDCVVHSFPSHVFDEVRCRSLHNKRCGSQQRVTISVR
jgi:hypothetical protein